MTTTYHSLAGGDFLQDWANIGLITTDGDWSGVPSITGYRGDDLTGSTGTDPRTITGTSTVVNVEANEANPTSFSTGGVAEFEIANPTIALNGSGTADAPYIVLYLNAADRENIIVSFNLRDLDASADNAVQQVVVQYRTSESGAWVNVPGGYVADATTANSATQVTPVSVTLPADANGATTLQVRVMTTNAVGNDEWVGVDDIRVESDPAVVIEDRPGQFSIDDVSVGEGNSGSTPITFTITRGADSNVAASIHYEITLPGGPAGADNLDFNSGSISGDLTFAANEFSRTITLQVRGDAANEADETFTVTLSAPTNGATIADGTGIGTILNDDAPPLPGTPFINEIHYDNSGTDVGEAIEIAGPAGTDLSGWTLLLYNATDGALYSTRPLVGFIIPNQDDGYGTVSVTYPVNGIQNGPADGIALVDPDGNVVQFLSYEGTITAVDGAAAGMTSTDIGVAEEPAVGVGLSLQLVGEGASYEDFSWTAARDDNFGAVNTDQNFIAPDATGLVSVSDAQVIEGDSGTTQLIFTVTRAGGLSQSAGVDWLLNLNGSANAADLGAGQPLSGHVDFGVGVSSVQVTIAVAGDMVGEPNETLNLLLANPAGNIDIVDGTGTGTILNDDPITLGIAQIQGAAHRSPYEGQAVSTTGIVTAVASNGFYLQDPVGDGNAATSEAIFIFTGGAPTVSVGHGVTVRGTVTEFLPGGNSDNLTTTELNGVTVTVNSTGNPLPAATLIGTGGLLPPSEVIEDDGFTSFDPATDGLDFYESLEGMRVTVDQPLVVANSNNFDETSVVASGGDGATGINDRGGITISEDDFNPERIQLDDGLLPGYDPSHTQGDILADVTGIISYNFASYELLVTELPTVVTDVTLEEEVTTLVGDEDHLTIASYNVENLDPGDGARFDLLAADIVYSLGAPDIIGLQEIQDADGAGSGSDLSGAVTAQALIDAIAAIGGPSYIYIEIAPTTAGSTGGEPGGNIRNGYLYNPDRVDYVEGSAQLIEDPAFNGSRRPLVADFVFNGQQIELINVHFTSRGGSDPLLGATQPPVDAGDAARTAQATAVAAYINAALAADPSLQLGVLGDFNGFYWEDAIGAIEGDGVTTDLHRLLDEAERYTYVFETNAQALDHMLVTGGLYAGAEFDVVHINAEFSGIGEQATDHDSIVGRFFIEAPNEAPTAVADMVSVDEDATTDNLWNLLLGNDTDPDDDALSIVSVDGSATLGSLIFDPASQSLRYVADDDSFDALAPGATATDSFTYTITDPDGLTSTATVTMTVTGIADGVTINGGNGNDIVTGTDGEDVLSGGNGTDLVSGLAGHDRLEGGNGNDTLRGGEGDDELSGGNGNDTLEGGAGADLFVIGRGGGNDVVLDYEVGVDALLLLDGIGVRGARVQDTNGDGIQDLLLSLSNGGGSVTLRGIDDLGDVTFATPAAAVAKAGTAGELALPAEIVTASRADFDLPLAEAFVRCEVATIHPVL